MSDFTGPPAVTNEEYSQLTLPHVESAYV